MYKLFFPADKYPFHKRPIQSILHHREHHCHSPLEKEKVAGRATSLPGCRDPPPTTTAQRSCTLRRTRRCSRPPTRSSGPRGDVDVGKTECCVWILLPLVVQRVRRHRSGRRSPDYCSPAYTQAPGLFLGILIWWGERYYRQLSGECKHAWSANLH